MTDSETSDTQKALFFFFLKKSAQDQTAYRLGKSRVVDLNIARLKLLLQLEASAVISARVSR